MEKIEQKNSNSSKKKVRGLGRGIGSLLGGPAPVNQPESVVEAMPPFEEKAVIEPHISEVVEVTSEVAAEVQGPAVVSPDLDEHRIWNIPIEKIKPNPSQPRTLFDPEKLEDLKNSIADKGVLQPIIVQSLGSNEYMIIAGERRWRASQMAGLQTVPVIIKNYGAQEILEVALIENIQRHDLNAIEEAKAYRLLMDLHDLTQEQVAQQVGKQRSTITNALRLLSLHKTVQDWVVEGKLTMGHARALLSVTDLSRQMQLARKVIDQKMTVRDVEKLASQVATQASDFASASIDPLEQKLIRRLEGDLQKILARKIKIKAKDSKGSIAINFYSIDELNRIAKVLADGWIRKS